MSIFLRLILSLSLAFSLVGRAMAVKTAPELAKNLELLEQHLLGNKELTPPELSGLEEVVNVAARSLSSDMNLIKRSLNLVKIYEEKNKPLFLNEKTKGGFKRKDVEGLELERVIFALQQSLLDHAFNTENLEENVEVFTGAKFLTADFFPGKADPVENAEEVLTSKVDIGQRINLESPQGGEKSAARRPTGWYLSPGTVAVITVPPEMINKDYQIRVGAHSWDLRKKPKVKRLDRISLVYPIKKQKILIANPLGGGVYIEVPAKAKGDVVTLHGENLMEAPFFSARHFDKMTNEEWLSKVKSSSAPWADFESEKVMMQLPSSWIKSLDDPKSLIADYDKCMDLISDLVGREKVRPKVILYHQVDVSLRGAAFFPGYPQ